MTRKMTLTMASVLALAVAAGAVQAQDRAPAPGKPVFEGMISQLDTDGDGKISRAEFEAPRLERLKAMDPNGDGILTLEEMKTQAVEQAVKRAEAMAERRFKALDVDGDGKVTAAEALLAQDGKDRPGHDLMAFERMDTDKDGYLSTEELRQHKPKPGPRGEHKRGPHGKPDGHDHGHEHGPKGPKPEKLPASDI